MSTKLSDLKSLSGKMFVFSGCGWWKISCMKYDRQWRLDKKPHLHPGNLLHLLNHHAGHDAPKESREEFEREGLQKAKAILNDWMRSQL